jgi:tetratricopeptide (TPR) repeat protein
MVLRLILLTLMIISPLALAKKKTPYFKKALIFYKQKQYSKAAKYVQYSIQKDFRGRAPGKVYAILGMSYWSTKNYSQARQAFLMAISKQYFKVDNKLRQQFQGEGFDLDDVPKGLLNLYFKIGSTHYITGMKKNNISELERSRFYFAATEEFEYNEERSSKILSAIDKKIEYINKLEFNWNGYLTVGNISWQETLNLRQNNGTSNPILSTVSGLCAGGGLRYENGFYGYKVDGCLAIATANLKKKPSAPIGEYNQRGVIVTAQVINGGIFFKSSGGGASYGLSGMVFNRSGEYTIPSGYTMPGARQINLGVSLDSHFELPWDLELDLQVANLGNVNLFSMRFNYLIF